ncbi:hypothetical protein B0H10DRAFT_2214834 [Mycena sp. CBHHK59/15]|nr:hypothetical protein B0H10DRAFT_2214834 [Mycena sp. CBHHK59/15]
MSEGQREDLVAASMLSTHKLMIVTFAAVLHVQQSEGAESLQTYLVSSAFKEHVVGQIRDLFLDPELSSYKIGFLSRLLEFWAFITTNVFATTVSKAATGARSELKWKQMKLIDYQERPPPPPDKKKQEYWDHINKELSDRWEMALDVLMADRRLSQEKIKHPSTHVAACHLSAAAEMEAYSQEELAGEENNVDEDDDENDVPPV